MKRTAEIVSHIFDPLVIFAFLGMIASFQSGLTAVALFRFLMIFLVAMVLPPAALLSWAVVTKRVSNWDVSDRRQRIKVLAIFLMLTIIDIFLVKLFANPELFKLFIFFFIWYLGFFAITLFWKISGHLTAVTLATLLLIRWYGWAWWPILLIIPLVGWARVASRNHSFVQVIAGVLYSSIVFEFVKFV